MKLPALLDEGLPVIGVFDRHPLPAMLGTPRLFLASQTTDAVAVLADEDLLVEMNFDAGRPQCLELDRDFLEQASGGALQALTPMPGTRTLAYLQSRRLVVYDLAQRAPEVYDVTDEENLEELATEGLWLSSAPRTLVVQIEDTTRYEEGIVDYRLRSFDISSGVGASCGSLELGTNRARDFVWHAGKGVIVTARGGRVEAFGPDLARPIAHPLIPLLQGRLSSGALLAGLRLHPERDLAICAFVDTGPIGKKTFQVGCASWESPDGARFVHLATTPRVSRLLLGDFSPEGAWMVIRVDAAKATRFYVQRIGATPEEPRLLGAVASPRAVCWTRSPTALLVFDEQGMIHRWRLEPAS